MRSPRERRLAVAADGWSVGKCVRVAFETQLVSHFSILVIFSVRSCHFWRLEPGGLIQFRNLSMRVLPDMASRTSA